MSFVKELTWRGLVHQATDPTLDEKMRATPFVGYAGFDPTADSLHVGSLIPILALRRLQRAGHRPIAVVGGATGMIGDPSGKSAERQLLDRATLERNVVGIRSQLERFLDFGAGPTGATLVDNYDWFREYRFLDFLRDVGKLFSVNMMMAKESVRARLEDRDSGISYTEFSYMLIQAYDFYWLHREHGCRLQVGGSDQWGNITAGIDLIRRLSQGEAYGITMPLVTTASGQKFGKTEKGTVWLDANRTSPYELFQFFLHTDDRDVGRFLRYYTFLEEPAIRALDEATRDRPEKREAQRALAREVVALVHGDTEAERAERAAAALFGGATDGTRKLDAEAIATVFADAPSSQLAKSALAGDGVLLVQLLAAADVGLAPSLSGARRDLAGGGIYLNEERVTDGNRRVTVADLVDGRYLLLRKGKKTYHVVRVE